MLEFLLVIHTTAANIVDKLIFIVPNKASKGSSGLANIGDKALQEGVESSIEKYDRPPIPSSISRNIFGMNKDTRISSDDWRNDLLLRSSTFEVFNRP